LPSGQDWAGTTSTFFDEEGEELGIYIGVREDRRYECFPDGADRRPAVGTIFERF